ncbi:MAG: DUF1848 domain-containing protein [Desulfobacterales bacterium]|nr:DUF1848 domain-containing protein [Desulfobacterales bacterium]
MAPSRQIVISASRRTDIPAFYMPWFMESMRRGFFEVVNPYNRHVSRVAATPDTVHTIVFWSKNFGPFLDGRFGEKLQGAGYNLFFNFTINSVDWQMEPNIPALNDRLDQLAHISRQFGAHAVRWRFDPICVYALDGRVRDNLADFSRIAAAAARCGLTKCVTSFVDDYAKIQRRLKSRAGFSFIFPSLEQKIKIVLEMNRLLEPMDIQLNTCCERQLMENLPPGSGVEKNSCVPNDFLAELFGGQLSRKKDPGQRLDKGCGCQVSIDIGSYQDHPCYHNCLFCYANPRPPGAGQ